SFVAVTIAASVVAWVSVRRWDGSVRVWLALGITASAIGDLTFELLMVGRDVEPDISVADGPWLAAYIGLSVAVLIALRKGDRTTRGDVDGIIDMGVIALVTVLVIWEFWLSDTISDSSVPWFVRAVWAAYPIMDAAVLSIVMRAIIERRTQLRTGVLLFGGALLWLLADFTWMSIAVTGLLYAALDVAWMLGAVLLAGACWSIPERGVTTRPKADGDTPVGKVRIVLAIVPFFVPVAIYSVSYYSGHALSPMPLVIATAGFAGLAGARALRLLKVRDEAQASLASSERLYRALAANSSDAVLLLDREGRIKNEAPDFAQMIGIPGVDIRGRHALEFVATDDVESHRTLDEILTTPGVLFSRDSRVPRDGMEDLWLSGRAVNLLDDPDVRAVVVNVHDVTARKHAEEELLHNALHDSLTGLANRALFRNRVEHALTRRARSGLDPAVIYLDLDGFKNVNDSLGHEAGDKLLREVASRLEAVVRSGDTVARLGGDEFGVLIEESLNVELEAEEIANRTLEALTAPVTLGEAQVTVSASLGIAHADRDSTASSLLRDADVAMYEAKATGKSRWVVYEEKMRDAAVERLRLENDLAHAVERRELRLMYQPVIELQSGEVVGFEALARWDHPQLGLIMPDRFIRIAEDSGLIVSIGRWVLEQACLTAARWRRLHLPSLTMAVNLSARQLAAPDICRQVREALAVAKLEPAALVLEMTETALVQDAAVAAVRLAELRKLGVRLAIDDFGTGYSSLAYLRQFPVDILKIDGSFIKTITDRSKVSPIVRGLLDLGRSLDLDIVAEGIESGAQLEQLRDQRCHLGQGFLFAEPLREADAESRLVPRSVQPVTV
ncbi:MAG TPA: EAL domain-containing protein, partial [Ilumatobacteraceae bacterium]